MRSMQGCAAASLLLIAAGCDTVSVRRDLTSFQRQRVSGVAYESAMLAAADALSERSSVTFRDVETGVLRSAPIEGRLGEARSASQLALGTPARSRRVAEIRVMREGEDIEFRCRVQLQQLESDPFRSRHYDRGSFDGPTDTPAQREASTTSEQNALWLTKRRDRKLERAILASIMERLDNGS